MVRVIDWLRAAGVTDIVINLHHRPETIAAAVGDGAHLHRADPGARNSRGDEDGFVEVARLDHVVPAELLLGLGERSVGR